MQNFFTGLLEDDLTTEVIGVQTDVQFTDRLDSLSDKLLTEFKNNGIPSIKSAVRIKEIKVVLDDLSDMVSNRFGYPIRIGLSDTLGYTIPIDGSFSTTLNPTRRELIKYLQERRSNNDSALSDNKHYDDSALENDDAVLATVLKHARVMDDLYNKGVKVDLAKAKVLNVADAWKKNGIVSMIFINPRVFIYTAMEARVLSGTILHEIGHQFTHIAYSNMMTKVAFSPLLSLGDDGLSKREKINVVHKKLGGVATDDADKANEIALLIGKAVQPNKNNMSAFYNNEISADLFSNRFGYGAETELAIEKVFNSQEREHLALTWAGPLMTLAMLAGMATLAFITSMPIIQAIVLMSSSLIGLYLTSSAALANSSIMDMEDVHEQSYARLRRVKLDVIRMLRTNKILPKSTKLMLEDFVALNNQMEASAVDKGLGRLVFTWLKGDSKIVGFHELYQRLEQLMENDLHAYGRMLQKG